MKTISWIAVFSGLTLTAGCASTPQVTGTEGRSSSNNPVSTQPAVDVATLDTDGDSVIDADDVWCFAADTEVLLIEQFLLCNVSHAFAARDTGHVGKTLSQFLQKFRLTCRRCFSIKVF